MPKIPLWYFSDAMSSLSGLVTRSSPRKGIPSLTLRTSLIELVHMDHIILMTNMFNWTSITTPFTCRWWQRCFCGWRGAFKRRNGGERRRQPCLNGFLGEEGQQLHHHHHHHPGGGGRQLPLRADLQQPWPTLGQAAWLWTRLVVALCPGLFGCWLVLFECFSKGKLTNVRYIWEGEWQLTPPLQNTALTNALYFLLRQY